MREIVAAPDGERSLGSLLFEVVHYISNVPHTGSDRIGESLSRGCKFELVTAARKEGETGVSFKIRNVTANGRRRDAKLRACSGEVSVSRGCLEY
jgi:hypothetical protein